jgi:putative transposase
VIYEFIETHEEYSVAKWASYFRISRAGYYEYLNRRKERQKKRDADKAKIKEIFDKSHGTYGVERICGILRKSGEKASYKRIRKLMKEMGLESVHNMHKTRSLTDSRKARGTGFPNLVRGKTYIKPLTAVCSDITYLKCEEGWLYYCMVKDIVSGMILGTATSPRMTKELVIKAFLNAQGRYGLAKGTIFHSDRGSQYTSKEFMDLLRRYGIRQSFSRIGRPGDNAWAESFFATLKKECIHFKQFQTREELTAAVFGWTEGFYNTGRVQARLGYVSPNTYYATLEKRIEKTFEKQKENNDYWINGNVNGFIKATLLTNSPEKC